MKKHLFYILFSLLAVGNYFAQPWTNLNGGYDWTRGNAFHNIVCTKNQVFVSGMFADNNGKNYVNRWNGISWSSAGNNFASVKSFDYAYALCADPSGNVYASGAFYGNVGIPNVIKWNGTSWTNLGTIPGTGAINSVYRIWSLCSDASGNVYAAGTFTTAGTSCVVARWNGSTWTSLGAPFAPGNTSKEIYTLCSDASGNIYAAGAFKNALGNNYVAEWNGSNWTELGAGANSLMANNRIYTIACDKYGNVYAGGDFSNEQGYMYVAKWNGSTWTELIGSQALNAQGTIHAIVCDKNGNVFCGGFFENNLEYRYVAWWNVTGWAELGNLNASARIRSLCNDDAGNIYSAGDFLDANNNYYVARFRSGLTSVQTDLDGETNQVAVSPNPSSDKVVITNQTSYVDESSYEIVDSKGVIVKTGLAEHEFTIDVRTLNEGMYYIRIFGKSLQCSSKLIIVR